MSDTIEMVLCTRCGKGCYDHRNRDGEVVCLTCVETEADEALDGAQDLIAAQARRVEELEGALREVRELATTPESIPNASVGPAAAGTIRHLCDSALTPSPAESVKPGAGDTWCGARRFGAQCALHAGHDGPHDSVPMGIFSNQWRDPEPPAEQRGWERMAWVGHHLTDAGGVPVRVPVPTTPQEPAAEGRVKIVKPARIPHIGEPHEGCECTWCWEMRSQGGACGCVTPDKHACTGTSAVCQCACHEPSTPREEVSDA